MASTGNRTRRRTGAVAFATVALLALAVSPTFAHKTSPSANVARHPLSAARMFSAERDDIGVADELDAADPGVQGTAAQPEATDTPQATDPADQAEATTKPEATDLPEATDQVDQNEQGDETNQADSSDSSGGGDTGTSGGDTGTSGDSGGGDSSGG